MKTKGKININTAEHCNIVELLNCYTDKKNECFESWMLVQVDIVNLHFEAPSAPPNTN